MKTNFKISLNFLLYNKQQTILIILGISVSIAIQFFLINMASGLQGFMIDRIIGSNYHIRIEQGENRQQILKERKDINMIGNNERIINRISDYENILASVKETEGVSKATAYLSNSAIYSQNGKTKSLSVIGADIKSIDKIYKISDKMVAGNYLVETNNVLIGKKLKSDMNLNLGDQISLTLPSGKKEKFRILGVFDLGSRGANESIIYMDLSYAQSIFNQKGYITTIDLQLTEPFQASNVAEFFTNRFRDLKISNWMVDMAELQVALKSQTFSILLIQFFITLASVLSVATILGVIVLQKSKQLGILKTMGLTNSSSRNIFLYQGIIFGVVTNFVGAIIGTILIKLFSKYSPVGFNIPVNLKYSVIILVVSFCACMLAAIYPAIKSKNLNPIDIIRGN